MDHPRGIERPYAHKTDEQRRKDGLVRQADEKAKGRAIKAAEWERDFGTPYPFRDS
jgi:hypothetical protein